MAGQTQDFPRIPGPQYRGNEQDGGETLGPRLWIVRDGALSGAENMLRDLELFRRYRKGGLPPVLRLYSWSGPTLSLGRFQDEGDVDGGECRRLGVEVVRRPTGGRAVLHGPWELTYCFVAGISHGLPSDLRGAYRTVLGILREALAALGLEAEMGSGTSPGPIRGKFSCFSASTPADLVVCGRKVCGSAQLREGGDFLQHGSIRLATPELEEDLLAARPNAARRVSSPASLSRVAGRPVRRAEMESALERAWTTAMNLLLLPHGVAYNMACVEGSRSSRVVEDRSQL